MAGYTLECLSGGTSVQGIGYAYNPASGQINRFCLTSAEMGFTTVASAAFIWVGQRSTTAPTGTTYVNSPDDPADAAAVILGKNLITVDASLTAATFAFYIPLYQNNSFRWVAENDRQRKMSPATASNGYMFGLSAATTTVGAGSLHFEQQ